MGYWNGFNYHGGIAIGGIVLTVVAIAITVIIMIDNMQEGQNEYTSLALQWSFVFLTIVQPTGARYLIRRLRRRLLSISLHKPSGFNLVMGMTNKQVYRELHRKTSGETAQEVQFLLSPDQERSTNRMLNQAESIFNRVMKVPTLEVVEANDKYAIVKKTKLYNNSGHISKDEIHYLTGINDEGYYFVHAIKDPEPPLDRARTWPKGYRTKLDGLVKYVNREDEGYKRLQGDVLYKFIRISQDGSFISINTLDVSGTKYSTELKPLDLPVLTPLKLGNHEVYYTGNYISLSGKDGGYWGIIGTKVIMKHNQHKDVVMEIPDGHCMVLTHQRSREIKLPDNKISKINFD